MGGLSWAQKDSNLRHPACKAGALNQLSYAPSTSLNFFQPDFPDVNRDALNQLNYAPAVFSGCKCTGRLA